jgi:hypothetical protein
LTRSVFRYGFGAFWDHSLYGRYWLLGSRWNANDVASCLPDLEVAASGDSDAPTRTRFLRMILHVIAKAVGHRVQSAPSSRNQLFICCPSLELRIVIFSLQQASAGGRLDLCFERWT